jgi:hypothetical protein
MRDRRAVLGALAAGMTGLAGCSSSDSGDEKAGGQPTKTVSKGQPKGKQFAYGSTFELPRIDVTLSNPRAMQSYQWHPKGEPHNARVANAGEGKQWIQVHLRAENTTDRTVRLPLTLNFKGVVGQTVYHPGRNKSPQKKYLGGKVESGDVREGDLTFLLPASESLDQFRTHYTEHRPGGKKQAWWQG